MNWELYLFLFALAASFLVAAACNTKKLKVTGTDWSQRHKCTNAAERILFDELAHHHFRMLTQVPIGKRQKIDIFLLDHDLAIEVDSVSPDNPEIEKLMRRKDGAIREKGWEVIRVSAEDVQKDTERVVARIFEAVGWQEEVELVAEPEPVPE